jgi:xanthine dehydrogenase accessory factor
MGANETQMCCAINYADNKAMNENQNSDGILERAAALKAAGRPFVLATVVRCESPTSARPGAKAIVDADGQIDGWIGGGCAQPAVLATAKEALADGAPRLIRVSPTKGTAPEPGIVDFGMTCHSGGTLDIFLEPVAARPALLIVGASPAARALSALAARTGYDVLALAPGADAAQFPDASTVADGLDPALLGGRRPEQVVVATQGKRDDAGLDSALATGCPRIAFIASARKAEKLKAGLLERGWDPERVAAITAPAGVAIGAVTPEEIALSVLAGLVQERRQGAPLPAAVPGDAPVRAMPASPAAPAAGSCCGGHDETGGVEADPGQSAAGAGPTPAATAIDPVCGMRVTVGAGTPHSRRDGADYWFCCGGCRDSFEREPARFIAATEAGIPA